MINDNKESPKRKTDPTRKYACCPICSTTLIQAESVKNAVIKCDSCHRRIFVEIKNGLITTKLYTQDED